MGAYSIKASRKFAHVDGKLLVTYASIKGSTVGVARTIGDELHNQGAQIDALPINLVPGVSEYSAVVIGSAIYGRQWLEPAVEFLQTYRAYLSHIPVAYFIVCVTMRENMEAHRSTVLSYLAPVQESIPEIKPVAIGAFAGAFNSRQWALPILLMLKARHELPPEGDFRNWKAIRAWARNLYPLLAKDATLAIESQSSG